MKLTGYRLGLMVLLLELIGCDDNTFEPIYEVDERFQPYVETFIEEALTRGYSYDTVNLIIRYDENLEIPYCGECNSNKSSKTIQKIISINPNFSCWDNPYQAEAFIFHELGHCVLQRTHLVDSLPNGAPKSMMVSDNIDVYSPCIYEIEPGIECNFIYRREYYLDELFDPTTPAPDWSLN